MSVYLPHVRLANVATGQAEVRLFTPAAPDVAFGFSRSLGWVTRNHAGGQWLAKDTNGVPLAAFPSRRAAVDYLAQSAK